MREISLNKFKANINEIADKVIDDHQAIRIKCQSGKDFVVISAEDWEHEQETMFVLGNQSLMSQIAESEITYKNRKDNK